MKNVATQDDIQCRLRSTDVLVVDEVSMISNVILRQTHIVCQAARKSCRPFGGIQVILTGDFLQLPPVNDKFCFEWDRFDELFPHRVTLDKVYRCVCFFAYHISVTLNLIYFICKCSHTETLLTSAVREQSRGEVTQDTTNFLKTLQRPVTVNTCQTTHLFAANYEVDLHNWKTLDCLPDDPIIYTAVDNNVSKQFESAYPVPKVSE